MDFLKPSPYTDKFRGYNEGKDNVPFPTLLPEYTEAASKLPLTKHII